MPQTLSFLNYSSLNVLKQTQLTSDIAIATTSIPVLDTQGFVANDYALIGARGSSTSEIRLQSIPTDSTHLSSAATVLVHQNYEPVSRLFGNQLKVYRAPNIDGSQPADTAFSLLATITIDPNSAYTSYTDSGGGGGYWYKFTYFNSTTSAETDIGSSRATRGAFTVNYCSIDEIRTEAGFTYAPYITDAMIDSKRRAAQSEINGALAEFYAVPLQPPINDFVRDLTIRLSASLLLRQQYGETVSDNDANGKNKYDQAEADLQKFVTKQRVITDAEGNSLAGQGAIETATGWPDVSTASASPSQGGAPRVFRMSDIQGKHTGTDSAGHSVGNNYYGRKW